MTPEERNKSLSYIESKIRDFRIVVVVEGGEGRVDGGFGHLPKSNDEKTRISNIEKSINKFQLVGNGIDVSGNFEEGFIFS